MIRLNVHIAVVAVLTLAGCTGPPGEEVSESVRGLSPSARTDIAAALRRDQETPRHPADGGGRVRFLQPPQGVSASQSGSWRFVYEAGARGIAEGGYLFFQAPPFWGWSTPQVHVDEAPGFTRVHTSVAGLTLEPATIDQQLLAIRVEGRNLAAGEEITIEYGAGPAGAVADRYAESRSCFFFAVDGDADGIRALVEPPLCVEVVAGPARWLSLTLPSTSQIGDRARLTVAMLDAVGNRATGWTGSVRLSASSDLALPPTIDLELSDAGARTVEVQAPTVGLYRVEAGTADGLSGQSNPMLVEAAPVRVLWADLHGHSGLTDGTGTPRDYFRYARDVAGLDVVALTDHDHWGMQPLAVHPELWEEIRRETELFHQPGVFVTLLGFEWTSWLHGHRHVLYFSDTGRILSSVDPEFETPMQLWDALRGLEALTFAHHSAGGPVATNWQFPPDPVLEPVTEIVSVHGSSEAMDSPSVIYSPVAGNFVRDVLDRGLELGFVGSGDGHDGHPGLAHLNGTSGGLAAILSPTLDREGVLQALRARRVYATNGPRILLRTSLAGRSMGSSLDVSSLTDPAGLEMRLEVDATAPSRLARMELIRSGQLTAQVACGESRCSAAWSIADPQVGEYLYVRVLQEDGGAAWSSPYFLR